MGVFGSRFLANDFRITGFSRRRRAVAIGFEPDDLTPSPSPDVRAGRAQIFQQSLFLRVGLWPLRWSANGIEMLSLRSR